MRYNVTDDMIGRSEKPACLTDIFNHVIFLHGGLVLPRIRSFSCFCVMGFALLASVDSRLGFAQQQDVYQAPPPPADPLTATIHTEDAERFARLFTATKGKPSRYKKII